MSFLAGRLAATEGAFFTQHSKQAAIALRQKIDSSPSPSSSSPKPSPNNNGFPVILSASEADVLPEVLRHSLPLQHVPRVPQTQSATAPSSLAASLNLTLATREGAKTGGPSGDGLRHGLPVELFATAPQTFLGPKRWRLETAEVSALASTANEARTDINNTTKQKALMEGYFVVTKAFMVATGLVFGGALTTAAIAGALLDIQSVKDIRTQGHEYFQPGVQRLQQSFEPLRLWAQGKCEKWKLPESHRRAIGADFAQSLGVHQMEDGKANSA
ncbi:hypothetical protein BDL97_14G002600 [Sphagnum fallax]|nr:hypothetical protein BDL97_14G002600 [Sphagnum fallax]